ncbi:MAG: hypothetical protein ACK5RV_05160 [Flavobacterium sp.]|jgi:hypothetical protein|uniref:hypothetical protein n=1 Tax=Flavobacterium sp. TaxID=239 RepID=UPI0022CC8742|nr:hypothetical protein [Flavobacterium sp.]MCZ8167539.1 hypothetical protein [Flavobacterium sp.]MCZ8295591.1 hypothetical protein [Flavobacterium sp.]
MKFSAKVRIETGICEGGDGWIVLIFNSDGADFQSVLYLMARIFNSDGADFQSVLYFDNLIFNSYALLLARVALALSESFIIELNNFFIGV